MRYQDICVTFGHLHVPRTIVGKRIRDQNQSKRQCRENSSALVRKHKFRYGYRKITALLKRRMQLTIKVFNGLCRHERLAMSCQSQKTQSNWTASTGQLIYCKTEFSSLIALFEKLVTDITYLPFGRKMLYLSSILDLFNGEIVAYTIG